MPKSLIIGATSSLGIAICRQLGAKGEALVLSGRNHEELTMLARDVSIRYGVETSTIIFDLESGNLSVDALTRDDLDSVYMVIGDMGNNDKHDIHNIERVIAVNFTAPAKILTAIASKMEKRRCGHIAIISSVAGDRGRQSNYPYGSAKAGLTVFASGLRNRLYPYGVHVMTVKPGFIDTPLTYGINSPLVASREYVAYQIIRALAKKKDAIYVPFFWRYIMFIICHIPEKIFKRLGL